MIAERVTRQGVCAFMVDEEDGEIKIQHKGDPDSVTGVLSYIWNNLGAVTTGAAASDRKDFTLTAGRVLQSVRGGRFLSQLLKEFKHFKEKGQVDDGFTNTDEGADCLQALLNAIDDVDVDSQKFSAMKAVFMAAAAGYLGETDDGVSPSYLIRILKELDSNSIIYMAVWSCSCHSFREV